MKNQKNMMTTAEFARLCGVKKDTLFHYDEIGLFSPVLRGENGYRYYDYQQLESFNVVWTLKEIGMPLSEIKGYFDARSPEHFIALLERQTRELDRKMDKLARMKDFIEKKRALTVAAMKIDPNVVSLSEEPARPLLSVPVHGGLSLQGLSESLLEFYDACETHSVAPHFIGGAVSETDARAGLFENYSLLYCTVPKPLPGCEQLDAGRYLITHAAGYAARAEGYERLFSYAAAHGLRFDSGFFEDTLLDETSVRDYGEYLMKLSVRVKPV